MSSNRLSRRAFLIAAGAAIVAGVGWRYIDLHPHNTATYVKALEDVVGGSESLTALGQQYLDALESPPDVSSLVERLRRTAESASAEVDALRQSLRRAVAADLDSERLVAVDGWMMSETEALVCAAIALAKSGSEARSSAYAGRPAPTRFADPAETPLWITLPVYTGSPHADGRPGTSS